MMMALRITSNTVTFTAENTKSKIDTFSKIKNWVKLKNKQQLSTAQQLFNEWSHFRVLYMESKLENFVSPKVSLWESKG